MHRKFNVICSLYSFEWSQETSMNKKKSVFTFYSHFFFTFALKIASIKLSSEKLHSQRFVCLLVWFVSSSFFVYVPTVEIAVVAGSFSLLLIWLPQSGQSPVILRVFIIEFTNLFFDSLKSQWNVWNDLTKNEKNRAREREIEAHRQRKIERKEKPTLYRQSLQKFKPKREL